MCRSPYDTSLALDVVFRDPLFACNTRTLKTDGTSHAAESQQEAKDSKHPAKNDKFREESSFHLSSI